jgi:hypothetical protein
MRNPWKAVRDYGKYPSHLLALQGPYLVGL